MGQQIAVQLSRSGCENAAVSPDFEETVEGQTAAPLPNQTLKNAVEQVKYKLNHLHNTSAKRVKIFDHQLLHPLYSHSFVRHFNLLPPTFIHSFIHSIYSPPAQNYKTILFLNE